MSKKKDQGTTEQPKLHRDDVDTSKGGTFVFDRDGYLINHFTPTTDGVRQGDPLSEIKQAIRGLDKSDASLWTDQGIPRVDAIETVLGIEITKSQRDSAWAQIKDA